MMLRDYSADKPLSKLQMIRKKQADEFVTTSLSLSPKKRAATPLRNIPYANEIAERLSWIGVNTVGDMTSLSRDEVIVACRKSKKIAEGFVGTLERIGVRFCRYSGNLELLRLREKHPELLDVTLEELRILDRVLKNELLTVTLHVLNVNGIDPRRYVGGAALPESDAAMEVLDMIGRRRLKNMMCGLHSVYTHYRSQHDRSKVPTITALIANSFGKVALYEDVNFAKPSEYEEQRRLLEAFERNNFVEIEKKKGAL